MGRTPDPQGHLKAGHEKAFKPTKSLGEKVPKAPYEYIPQGVGKKKHYRDQDGAVIVGPRNIMTNPIKTGKVGKNTLLGAKLEYIPDDYWASKK